MREAVFDPQRIFSLGLSLHQEGRLAEAQAMYGQVLDVLPEAVEPWTYLGMALIQQGEWHRALHPLDRSLALSPNQLDPLIYRGMALANLGRHPEAARDFEQAAGLAPDRADLINSLVVSLLASHRYEEALVWLQRATAADPACLVAHFNTGNTLQGLGRMEEAFQSFDNAMRLDPSYPQLMGYWLGLKLQLCDWSGLNEAFIEMARQIDAGVPVAAPFSALSTPCTPAQLLLCAQMFAKAQLPPAVPAVSRTSPSADKGPGRIKLGYFSADFHEHATAYLAAGLFEQHDRERFEVVAFSYGPTLQQPMRSRLEAAFDKFIDVSKQTDAQVAALAQSLHIDIAIDLKGYTANARLGIFSYRPAPVQVSYLGYPGTLGVDHIDYLIADAVLIRDEDRVHYSEKIVTLPASYQVNDDRRRRAATRATRAACGLPEDGVVLCCFNNSFKITPDVFAVWMGLLQRCPDTVLWLLATSPRATTNLMNAARGYGVAAERLIFAPQLPQQAHLDRLTAADLFLDTFWVNAHTTASDALWAGVPVITSPGATFASRVGASLLSGLGLQELIAPSPADYAALAQALIDDRVRLQALREKVAHHRDTHALFDTRLFTRRIEQAYTTMWGRYLCKQPPCHFEITA